ncbi:MAG: glutamine-hydrolyzing carbamoyl-phosphate synthase small subunit [Alphaproteobacteria bacterium]|nr:glutamine-hydrolyzing carbamoyl-phosphate synthase small subunit [Alphaproteobacteria bacterium]
MILADGTVFWGKGIGEEKITSGEICFNTSITGYQEILTDPSYADQIITFTFPHIGNVGTNSDDMESAKPVAKGLIVKGNITNPANFRSVLSFEKWLKKFGLVGISGIDTRKLTEKIRENGSLNGVIQHSKNRKFNFYKIRNALKKCPNMEGLDLAIKVSTKKPYVWKKGKGKWKLKSDLQKKNLNHYHVVAIDYGAKRNILRCLSENNCKITVVPAKESAKKILNRKPDGIFLSNGPGDPAATGTYAVPIVKELTKSNLPIFGICLGHQLLAITLGAKTKKMHHGHRGANHPVKNLKRKRVEITSQNHGFVVDSKTIPKDVDVTHLSLFDNSIEGIKVKNKPIFSVQFHPEASPGPQDTQYLFDQFVMLMKKNAKKK